ncbi:APC family permease [Allokutzneria sp. NRRL B-24872]|uniref:APC family permease n=1 Tax=Allokutzneria sp. NRRL B-24872 TaxID=1137961 RepID=UPI000A388368|nr:APC family permease [Allokutzneria sp. NRRL B-24872]
MSETTPPSTAAAPAAEGQPELKRAIGPKLLLFFVIGDILGTGVYALMGDVAGQVGGALWVPFLIAFVVAFLTAFSYLELVGKYPKAAGAALYTNRAFRKPFFTFMIAFTVMCSGITSASSAAVAFGGTYLKEFVQTPAPWVAIGFIVLLAFINFRGVGESVKANVVLTIVELSGLVIIVGIGVMAVVNGQGDPGRLVEFNTANQSTLIAITSATSLAFFAMVGFEDSVNMAEECKDPVKIFPRSMLLGMAVAGSIYVMVAVTSSLLIPAAGLKAAGSGALLEVVKVGAPGFPLALFSFIGLFAVANSALINMLMASRLVYGMANEKIIPMPFAKVHQTRRTPWIAIGFTSIIAIFLVSFVPLKDLGGTTALLLLIVFTVVNIACLVLRKEKAEHKHFRAPTIVPVIGAITCAYLALPFTGRAPQQYVLAAILLGIGLVMWMINWFFFRRKQHLKAEFDAGALTK